MAEPWKQYQAAGPWDQYAAPAARPTAVAAAPKKAVPQISALDDLKNAVQGGLIRGWKGAQDTISNATRPANPLAMIGQGLDTVDQLANLGRAFQGKPQVPKAAPPVLPQRKTGAVDPNYRAKTSLGRYAGSIAEMSPALVAPGSAPARIANMVLPGVSAQGAEDIARGLGANDQIAGYARAAGGLLGGVGAGLRPAPRPAPWTAPSFTPGPAPGAPPPAAPVAGAPPPAAPMPTRDAVFEALARGQDPQRITAQVARYQAAGIRPSLIDVVDDAARGTVRAAASRQTPARQATTDFRDARALNLPSRMSTQARRIISQDARTPDQIRAAEAARRSAEADTAFSAVRHDAFDLHPDSVQALRTDYGRRAIAEAAARERNPEVRAALNRLHGDAFDNPGGTQITVGMADRVSRVLSGQAQAAFRTGDNDLGGLLSGLAENIRGPARSASPGYRTALEGYGADTRLMNAAETGENLLTRNTDEFVQHVGAMSPEERLLARAAARRAIERRAGESTGQAPGVARAIADAPEQQMRNAALLGDDAPRFQDAMRLEEMRVRNANDVAPRFGSQTQNKQQDAGALANGVQVVQRGVRAAHGDPTAAVSLIGDWIRSRGFNDRDAQRLGEIAISDDPANINALLDYLTRQSAPRPPPVIFQPPAGLMGQTPRPAPTQP